MKIILAVIFLVSLTLVACNSNNKNSQQFNQTKMRITADSTDDKFIISHVFETEPEKLFQMWTDPEVYTSWMGPTGTEMSFINADVREGGSALWQMTTPDGLTKFCKLHYKTIQPNNKFSYVQFFSDKDGNFIKAPFSETYPDSLLLTVDFENLENKVKMKVQWEIVGESK